MQAEPKNYGLSGVVAVMGLIALVVGLVVTLTLPSIRFAAWLILALGAVLLVIALILDYRRVGRAIVGKRGIFSAGTTVMASIFIGIIVLANAISLGNFHRFDFTGVSQFTLTSQTKEALAELETPVQVLAFFTPNDPYGIANYATTLLEEYQDQSEQISIEYIDPDEHPDQARQYGITQYQTIAFQSQERFRLVFPAQIVQQAEHSFTSAILEVTGEAQKKIYFLTGHGESDIYSEYSQARQGLLDNLYQVETLDLVISRGIPEDATALIIAAPERSLASNEVDIIKDYLENDGWLMIMTNPDSPPAIAEILSPWGIDLEKGTIVDESSYVDPNIGTPSVPRSRNFFGMPTLYFPGATALIPQSGFEPNLVPFSEGTLIQIFWTNENSSIEMYSLLRTSQDSWLEKDFNPLEQPAFDEGTDIGGPLNIGFLIGTATDNETQAIIEEAAPRIIVIGDSDFASDQHFFNGQNGEFFLNSVEMLTAGTELISIERKVLPFRRLIVGPEAARFISYSSIALLPV
jgi:ABC-type uncharacterized transport system involved in gliding motility auxiliary subunit